MLHDSRLVLIWAERRRRKVRRWEHAKRYPLDLYLGLAIGRLWPSWANIHPIKRGVDESPNCTIPCLGQLDHSPQTFLNFSTLRRCIILRSTLHNCVASCCIVEHSGCRILQHCQQIEGDSSRGQGGTLDIRALVALSSHIALPGHLLGWQPEVQVFLMCIRFSLLLLELDQEDITSGALNPWYS